MHRFSVHKFFCDSAVLRRTKNDCVVDGGVRGAVDTSGRKPA